MSEVVYTQRRRLMWRRRVAWVRPAAGAIEAAVRTELDELNASGALAEVARYLARAMDAGGHGSTQSARLAQELRVTLGQLREIARERADDGQADASTPAWSGSSALRDGAQPGPADLGAEGGGGGGPAG